MQRQTSFLTTASASFLFLLAAAPAADAQFGPSPGQVFTSTNAAAANEVAVFTRGTDGSLTSAASVSTGGQGSGDALGSQGALALSPDLQWLLVVNAGSDDVSVFSLANGSLTLTDREASGGDRPVSVAMFGSLVYVLNAGAPNNVSGFLLSAAGDLAPIANSSRPLSQSQTMPAQVEISPDGAWLVVTEKMTNVIDVWPIGAGGLLGPVSAQPSAGVTPFGFAFRGTQLVVSEAFMAATDGSAVSSYAVGAGGVLATVSASVPTTETAACWIAIPNNMLYAYTTNTGSNSISGYFVQPSGALTLLDSNGVTAATGAMPTDLSFARDMRLLFALESGLGSIASFRIAPGGALQPIGNSGLGLPTMTVVGLVAY